MRVLILTIFITGGFLFPGQGFAQKEPKQITLGKSTIQGKRGKPKKIPLLPKKRYTFNKNNKDTIQLTKKYKKKGEN